MAHLSHEYLSSDRMSEAKISSVRDHCHVLHPPPKGFSKPAIFAKFKNVSNIVTIFLYLECMFLMYGALVNLYIHNMLILTILISTEKFKPI